ncbi:pentapeptide repeat family protein [Staphylococcus phage PMBT8]|nr:pentapeptide repeat family protein [Staphylococcus phage PMBT8]
MKKITQKELDKKLKLHELWLDDNTQGVRLDLSGLDLKRVDLEGANLQYAILNDANLYFSDLKFANLTDVSLIGANLTNTHLNYAILSGVNLAYADLTDANLTDANLNYANLTDANLAYADLTYANLKYANLSGANTTHIRGLKVFSVDNIGTFKGKVTYIPKLDKVFAGCWEGSLEEFLYKGLEMNEDEAELQNIKLVYQFFKNNKEE